jgi:alpha-1,2-mannosyltransferase
MESNATLPSFTERGNLFRWALALWLGYFLVLAVLVVAQPDRRTVTPNYRTAAAAWAQQAEMYHPESQHGFLYLPAFTVLYTPLTFLPRDLGEVLWRALSVGLFAWGLWRVQGLIFSQRQRASSFFWLTLLVIPASLASGRNGQTNLLLAASVLHLVPCLVGRQWNQAAGWLTLAYVVKPPAGLLFAMLALAYPALRGRMMLSLAMMLALPFLFQETSYVLGQYHSFFAKMAQAGFPTENEFNDLQGLLRTLEPEIPLAWVNSLRAGLALLCCGACLWCGRALSEGVSRAFYATMIAVIFLMVGSSRTEANTYVVLVPFFAVLATYWRSLPGSAGWGVVLGLVTLAMGTENYGRMIFEATNHWLKASLSLIVLLVICVYLFFDAKRLALVKGPS